MSYMFTDERNRKHPLGKNPYGYHTLEKLMLPNGDVANVLVWNGKN